MGHRRPILYDLACVVVAYIYDAVANGITIPTSEANLVLCDFYSGRLLYDSCCESVWILRGHEANATAGNVVGVECGGDDVTFCYCECGNRHRVSVVGRV